MTTHEVIARVYIFVSLSGLESSRHFYRESGLNVSECTEREWRSTQMHKRTRHSYAACMGLTPEEFDQDLPDFLTTLKTRLEYKHGNEENTRRDP